MLTVLGAAPAMGVLAVVGIGDDGAGGVSAFAGGLEQLERDACVATYESDLPGCLPFWCVCVDIPGCDCPV